MTDTTDHDEQLSAYLDGELSPSETADIERLLSDSPQARESLAELERTRALVRDLPLLEPPLEVQRMLRSGSPLAPVRTEPRRRSRVRATALSAVAVAAFWGVIVGASGFSAAVTPSIDSAVAAHTSFTPGAAEGEPDMAGTDDMPMDMEPAGMTLVHAERQGRITHAMYSDGTHEVSVFAEPGRIDWSQMPDGDRIEIGGEPAWHGAADGYDIIVLERGRHVVTIVAEAPEGPDDMVDMGESMSDDNDTSFVDRVQDAADSVVRFFGLRG